MTTISIEFPEDFAVTYTAPKTGEVFTVALADMVNAPKTLGYLAARGFTENLTNAAALSKDQIADKLAKDPKFNKAAYVLDRRNKLTLGYLNGDFDESAGAPRLTREQRVQREVTLLFMTAYLERKGEDSGQKFKLPDGEVLTKMLEKYASNPKNASRIEAEVQRRLAIVEDTDESDDEDDMDDLLAVQAEAEAARATKLAEKAAKEAKAA